ncbi:DUF2513 domain-containing protein [Paracoccus liaowanqingii]|uniref:DUF2513 domain-containing protein n=1 Tax=Paracoccus liaowanqingii TaxID=2560053 RepID=A0A4Z1CS62_9RHOB|nr:DUF2513 domain-containing protein [Paracoccus liaowanqingii]TGN68051.1 DUF2513 domain-containing protein [Paracoccus liaowanqingii]
MKLDLDLIRDILLWIEENQSIAHDDIHDIELPGHNDHEVAYHVARLAKAGFVDATLQRVGGTDPGEIFLLYSIHAIEWPGHDLLEHLRDKTAMERAKGLLKAAGVKTLTELFKALQAEGADRLRLYLGGEI